MKPLLCFDMDETLIHSNKVHIKSFNKAFMKNKLKKISEKKIRNSLQGEDTETIIKNLYPNLSREKIRKIHMDKRKIVMKETYKYARQIQNSGKILKMLKKYYRIAILSNCTHKEIKKLLDAAKIKKGIYDILIGKDEVIHAKPYPDEIFKAEKLLKEKAEFVIGDSLQDIKAGKKAKVRIIIVLTGNTPKEKLINSKPDYIIKSIRDIPKILRGDYGKKDRMV